jgi:hypothetical protein
LNLRQSQTFTFVDAANGNFDLAATDAGARTYGVDLSADALLAVSVDITGTTRGAVVDIGAHQVTTSSPSNTSVEVPVNDTYLQAEVLSFTTNWDMAVDVTGTPRIELNIGGTTKYANYVSGTGTTALVFAYAIETGLQDLNGIVVGALGLNGGTIKKAGTAIDAGLTLHNVGVTTGVLVDSQIATVSSVGVPADGTYIVGQNLNFTVNFSRAVTVTGVPQLPLIIGGAPIPALYLSGSGTTALVFRDVVAAGLYDADGIETGSGLEGTGTIKDSLGRDADFTLNSVGSLTGVMVNSSADSSDALKDLLRSPLRPFLPDTEPSPPPVGYETETTTLLAAMTVEPSTVRKDQINDMIVELKDNGLWAKLDLLYVTAAHDSQAGRLNWKTPASNTLTTAGGTPSFTVDRGFTGGPTGYLTTSTAVNALTQYTQNSACVGAVSMEAIAIPETSAPLVGLYDSGAMKIDPLALVGVERQFVVQVNDAALLSGENFDTAGYFVANRSGA